MITNRRRFVAASAAAAFVASAAGAQEADYSDVELPSTINIIVASSAGGSSDALVRVTAPYFEAALEELTGQGVSTVVNNMPGAGTEIGATALASATPDGSTIGLINLPHLPLLEAAREVQFEPWLESFVPLGLNVVDPNVFVLGNGSSYETVAEAVTAAQKNPGSVVVGAQGPLSDDQLALYALQQATGATFAFIPYAGGSDANRALLSGEIDVTVGNIFDYIQLEDAAADAAVFSASPSPMLPNVPTFEQAIGVDVGELGSTRGFAAPAGLPDDMISLYREAFAMAFASEDYVAEAQERSITLIEPLDAEGFGAVMADQQDVVSELVEVFREGGYIE